MKLWQPILIPFAITVVVGGIYLLVVWKHRQAPGVTRTQPEQKLTADDVAVVRMEFTQHYEDLADLQGKSVWMKNGNAMPYFPYVGGRVEFTKQVGLIPPDQKLEIKKFIKAAVPASVRDKVEHGDRQAMAVFALPDGKELYATPVGYLEGNQEAYYTDLLFYYDDPHTIYSHWPKDVWSAIDAHQVKPGMSELQVRTAIGTNMHPDGEKQGNRTITYDVNGKETTITFRNNHATKIETK